MPEKGWPSDECHWENESLEFSDPSDGELVDLLFGRHHGEDMVAVVRDSNVFVVIPRSVLIEGLQNGWKGNPGGWWINQANN